MPLVIILFLPLLLWMFWLVNKAKSLVTYFLVFLSFVLIITSQNFMYLGMDIADYQVISDENNRLLTLYSLGFWGSLVASFAILTVVTVYLKIKQK